MTEEIPAGRSIRFYPGYDKRATDVPGKTYGVHGMTIAFYLRGEEGIVQFKFNTGWVPWEPRPVGDRLFGPSYDNSDWTAGHLFPMAEDLGYHSPRLMYESQTTLPCPFLGEECYYDGSGLNADPVLVALIYDGEEAVWDLLTKYYARTFQSEDVRRDSQT